MEIREKSDWRLGEIEPLHPYHPFSEEDMQESVIRLYEQVGACARVGGRVESGRTAAPRSSRHVARTGEVGFNRFWGGGFGKRAQRTGPVIRYYEV